MDELAQRIKRRDHNEIVHIRLTSFFTPILLHSLSQSLLFSLSLTLEEKVSFVIFHPFLRMVFLSTFFHPLTSNSSYKLSTVEAFRVKY